MNLKHYFIKTKTNQKTNYRRGFILSDGNIFWKYLSKARKSYFSLSPEEYKKLTYQTKRNWHKNYKWGDILPDGRIFLAHIQGKTAITCSKEKWMQYRKLQARPKHVYGEVLETGKMFVQYDPRYKNCVRAVSQKAFQNAKIYKVSYSKIRYNTCKKCKTLDKLRNACNAMLRATFIRKNNKTVKTLGWSEQTIREIKALPNFGKKNYTIDHIIPLSAFDADNPLAIQAAFAPKNIRVVSKSKNSSKAGRLDYGFQQELINQYWGFLNDFARERLCDLRQGIAV